MVGKARRFSVEVSSGVEDEDVAVTEDEDGAVAIGLDWDEPTASHSPDRPDRSKLAFGRLLIEYSLQIAMDSD